MHKNYKLQHSNGRYAIIGALVFGILMAILSLYVSKAAAHDVQTQTHNSTQATKPASSH